MDLGGRVRARLVRPTNMSWSGAGGCDSLGSDTNLFGPGDLSAGHSFRRCRGDCLGPHCFDLLGRATGYGNSRGWSSSDNVSRGGNNSLSHCRCLSHGRSHCWGICGSDRCTDGQVQIWIGQ